MIRPTEIHYLRLKMTTSHNRKNKDEKRVLEEQHSPRFCDPLVYSVHKALLYCIYRLFTTVSLNPVT